MRTRTENLGSLLLQDGLISPPQLHDALAEQTRTHQRLGEILIARGFIRELDLVPVLAHQFSLEVFDPGRHSVDTQLLDGLPYEMARRYKLLLVAQQGQKIQVAMADPTDIIALDRLRQIFGCEIEMLLAPTEVLNEAIERHYGRIRDSRNVEDAMAEAVVELGRDPSEDAVDANEAAARAQDAPIIKLVEQIIGQALGERATDIHIEPYDEGLVVRYRIDGILSTTLTPPRSVRTGLITRIKILSNLDIAETRKPQDGRFTVRSGGSEVDVRVSTIPTIHGEKVVLRLLEKSKFSLNLPDLGFSEVDYAILRQAIHEPYGMVLLSGPTGSGKTTTLYASLLELKNDTVNITTVEDPVEYQIAGVNQVQVNPRKNVTFATALRSFLRQDPDVMMVGEIRDAETAEMAIRAALTGHMVFSTIHANDAPSTITRLLSLGPDPFQTGSALTLVAAQRLVRRVCPSCVTEYEPEDKVLAAFPELESVRAGRSSSPEPGVVSSNGVLDPRSIGTSSGPKPRFLRGRGCGECRGRGYRGRVAILELLRVTSELRWLIVKNASPNEIREVGAASGMKSLRQNGVEKALRGVTTLEEVLRVSLSE